MNRNSSIDKLKETESNHVIGVSVWKVDGIALVTGAPCFTDDVYFKDLLYCKILTSPHAHARIINIDTTEAENLAGVKAVACYKNVPRIPYTTAGQGYPEPSPYDTVMFDTKVRFVGDRVAAVVGETLEIVNEALKLIKVEYELLPAIFDPRDAIKEGAPQIHDEPDSSGIYDPKHNIAAHYEVEIGNLEDGFSQADAIVEGEFITQYVQHCPIEPHVCICYLDENKRLVIRTSTQVPFHCRRIVARVLGIPINRIRVIKPRIGGGFGVKQEIVIEDVCAYFALKLGKPVKLEYSRQEEFISSRTRHPMIIKFKAGAKKDGSITAMDMNVLSNTGAYGTHSLTVLCNVGSKNLPLYPCANVRFYGNAVYTNLPIAGAYRGYGATQGTFAMECIIDELAEAIGMDPLEFRKMNHIKTGESSPIFAAMGEGRRGFEQSITSCGLTECIEAGATAINWHTKRKSNNTKNSKEPIKRGIGMACTMQGSGIAGIDMGSATIKMNDDGSFNLLVGATDLGTGSDTVLAQIAAGTLSVDVNKIIVYSSDTDLTPFDKGAYASSTVYISGGAVKKAAEILKNNILGIACELLQEEKEDLICKDGIVVSKKSGKSISYSDIANRSFYTTKQTQLTASASHVSYISPPPFAAHFAEVEVDTETGKVRVIKYVAAVDCGVAINPKLAEAQAEGAIINGIGYALCEKMVFDKQGRMINPNFRDYKICTALDIPEIEIILIPTYEPTGPFGAKSIAEININGPLPAIANAIYNACGIRLREAPFTPENVLKALEVISH